MEKRKDVQLYMFAYQPVDYGFLDNSLYTPVQCGANRNEYDLCELKDNTGDNISDWNFFYCEVSGLYWVWKNAPHTKYIGSMSYRRRLIFDENTDFDEIFKHADVITARPYRYPSVYNQYMQCHNIEDLNEIISIIMNDFKEYQVACMSCLVKGQYLFWSDGFVMRWEDFDRYCKFLFGVLFKYISNKGFTCYDDVLKYVSGKKLPVSPEYQTRIGGYLAERIFTTYVMGIFKNFETMDYTFMEKC